MSFGILSRYQQAPLATRFFLLLRWALTPYRVMASRFASQGRILDMGCGHGLLALRIALESRDREVLGLDHDELRVAQAQAAAQGVTNLRFGRGSALAFPPGPFVGVALIDVMHYFEPAEQERILKQAFDAVSPGGVVLVREVDPQGGGFASTFNRFYEKIATRTGFTRSDKKEELFFRRPEGWVEALRKAGFQAKAEPCSSFLFADILFTAIKPIR